MGMMSILLLKQKLLILNKVDGIKNGEVKEYQIVEDFLNDNSNYENL